MKNIINKNNEQSNREQKGERKQVKNKMRGKYGEFLLPRTQKYFICTKIFDKKLNISKGYAYEMSGMKVVDGILRYLIKDNNGNKISVSPNDASFTMRY